ncbi:fungal-specific transcription factor domain-containing protein [Cunninghamella echinulata]|nr:fungal-specific transcription factor domain-containing protein [Cunninghamella echinulata]
MPVIIVKCDGLKPCSRCNKSRIECAYEKQQNNKNNSGQALIQQLSIEKRIEILKQKLNQLKVDSIPNPNYNPASDSILYPPLPLKPIDKFSVSIIGQPFYVPDFNARMDRLPIMNKVDPEIRNPNDENLKKNLPVINQELLSIYFNHFHPYFPILLPEHQSFLEEPILLNCIYAIASQWIYLYQAHQSQSPLSATSTSSTSSSTSTTVPPGHIYYNKAISLVELYADSPRISFVQSLLLIIKFQELVQRHGFLWRTRYYFQMAIKMANDLGLSRPIQCHPIMNELRGRVFWAIYIYDIALSTELGIPMHYQTEKLRLPLPIPLPSEQNKKESYETALYFHWLTMVMKTHGTVLHYLRQKYHHQDHGNLSLLYQHIKALKSQLQKWEGPGGGRVNFLFLAYHFTNILLYRSIALDLMKNDKEEDHTINIKKEKEKEKEKGKGKKEKERTILNMNAPTVKSILLEEASSIISIIHSILKDHPIICLHYAFRGIQQIIHYLIAARTVFILYEQANQQQQILELIQQLVNITPVIELRPGIPNQPINHNDLTNNSNNNNNTNNNSNNNNNNFVTTEISTNIISTPMITTNINFSYPPALINTNQHVLPQSFIMQPSMSMVNYMHNDITQQPLPQATISLPTTIHTNTNNNNNINNNDSSWMYSSSSAFWTNPNIPLRVSSQHSNTTTSFNNNMNPSNSPIHTNYHESSSLPSSPLHRMTLSDQSVIFFDQQQQQENEHEQPMEMDLLMNQNVFNDTTINSPTTSSTENHILYP